QGPLHGSTQRRPTNRSRSNTERSRAPSRGRPDEHLWWGLPAVPRRSNSARKSHKVAIRWLHDMYLRQRRLITSPTVSGEPPRGVWRKCARNRQRSQSQSTALGPGETLVPPPPSPFVNNRISVVRVDEHIYVGQDHGVFSRKTRPPTRRQVVRVYRDRYLA